MTDKVDATMNAIAYDNQLNWLEVIGVDVDEFLLSWPLTYLKQTKFGWSSTDNQTKYEYWP